MVRRIVKCSSCFKRFATASAQDLCPTCRPKCVASAAPPPDNLKEETTVDLLPLQSRNNSSMISDNAQLDNDLSRSEPSRVKKRKQSADPEANVDVDQVRNKVAKAPPIQHTLYDEYDTNDNDSQLKKIDSNKVQKPDNDAVTSKSATKAIDEDELYNWGSHSTEDNDLRCTTKSTSTELTDDKLDEEEVNNPQEDGSCCGSENDDLLVECIEIDDDSEDDTHNYPKEAPDEADNIRQPQIDQKDNSENDVCYICGSNLSGKGLKSRVAHMKRCSSKYGQAMKPSHLEEEEDMLPHESSSKATANPYKSAQWHSNAGKPAQQSNEKQSMLNQFFKAPVRSLTNVLMAGSRQASKKKVDHSSALKTTTKNKGKQFRKGSWSSSNRGSGKCPSYKQITGTDFVCDGFYYAGKLTQNYFLTHFHSDHYGGITKNWKEGIIYCSLPTANLVHQNLGVEQKYLHPLPMNEPTVVSSKDKAVKVTLLDANHCPGAVMFLFEVGNRRILHVGDFRWNRNIMLGIPQIRALSSLSPRLDELFLDTTYCNPKYELPTQEEAISAAIDVANEEMEKSKRGSKTLFLFGSYTIGKEKIYLSVAQHLKKKVYVDSRRLRILKALEWPKEKIDIFTTKKEETPLWVVPLGKVNFKNMPEFLEQANNSKGGKALAAKYERVVGFRPTGWAFTAKDKNQSLLPCGQPKPGRHLINSKTNGKYSVHGVPYSEHSSFPELVDCVHTLKPRKIVTTVSPSKSDEQIELLLNAANSIG